MVAKLSALGHWFIDIKNPGDVVEKLAYIAAVALGVAMVIGVVAVMGTLGLVTLLRAFVVLVMIKWGWLWLLR